MKYSGENYGRNPGTSVALNIRLNLASSAFESRVVIFADLVFAGQQPNKPVVLVPW